jgi:NADH-quinone oxidoreductase subunit H
MITLEFILEPLVKIALVIVAVLLTVAYSVYAERKVSALIQDRIGPNRVGPFGLFQPFADVMKLAIKEDIVPRAAHHWFHRVAPMISLSVALAMYAMIPLGNTVQLFGRTISLAIMPGVNIGILYMLALSSVGVYGITLSGWASNNKYSLMGGMRSSAQMISYELSLGLSLIGVVMIAGTLRLDGIIATQGKYFFGVIPAWNMFIQPVAFITFVVAMFAETNRTPFDLPEAEPELVGGFHTEYTGLKFGLFFLAEYANVITASFLITTLFCGGWQFPYGEQLGLSGNTLALVQVGGMLAKVAFWILFFIWVRWSIPRFRYDQLMRLGWKVMLPVSLANIVATAIVLQLLS